MTEAGSCFACTLRRANRIAPSDDNNANLCEIRPNRFLNIVKLGPNADATCKRPSSPVGVRINQDSGLAQDVGCFPDGQTALFFIHGVGGSSRTWQAQYEYFSHLGFDVIVPDLIGHGESCAPMKQSAYHFSEIALDVLVIFDRFHKKRNVLIGHSYGSSFATLVAKERETFVTKLILISSGGPTALSPQSGIFQLPICMLSCFKTPIVKRLLRKAFYKDRDLDLNRNSAFRIPTYVLRYTMRGQDWLVGDEDYHESLLVPTLLIYGVHDQLVTIEEEMATKGCINGSKLVVIDDCSHMVTVEKPEAVNRYIQQFLALKEWYFVPRTEMTRPNGSVYAVKVHSDPV